MCLLDLEHPAFLRFNGIRHLGRDSLESPQPQQVGWHAFALDRNLDVYPVGSKTGVDDLGTLWALEALTQLLVFQQEQSIYTAMQVVLPLTVRLAAAAAGPQLQVQL